MEIKRLLKKAKAHEKKGQVEEAIQLYLTILEAFPKNQETIKRLKQLRSEILQNSYVDQKQDEINAVIALYSQGNIQQSLQSAQALIKKFPKEVILFNISGICYSGLGQFNESVASYKYALKLQPDCVEVHFNLGNSYQAIGEFESAITSYKQVLRINPSYDKAYFNIGIIHTDLAQLDLAILNYNQVLKINPNYSKAYNNLGNIYKEKWMLNEAVENYQQAIKITPDFAELHYNLGTVLMSLDKLTEAIKHYELALKINPDYVEASFDLGIAYSNLHKHERAIKCFKQVINYRPDNPEAFTNLGNSYNDLGLQNEAITSFQQALELNPNDAEAHCNLGKIFLNQGPINKAISCFEQALEISPDNITVLTNLGSTNAQLGKIDAAFNYYDRALTINPEFIEGRFFLSLLQLGNGYIAEGFKNNEIRWQSEEHKSLRRLFSVPRWHGESLQGKNILLWGEQGIGDEVQFATLIPEFKELGCHVGIECAAKLVEIFQWSFPWAEVRETGAVNCEGSEAYRLFDYQIPMGSIAPLFRKTIDDFSAHQKPFIPRLNEGEKKVRNKLKMQEGELLIGLSWRSSKQSFHDLSVEDLAPLKSLKNVVFLAVQYGECLAELDLVRSLGLPIHYYTDVDQKDDISSTCALLGACDLVFSPGTAVYQISASLGVPTIGFDAFKSRKNRIPWHPTARYFELDPDNPSSLINKVINDISEIIDWADQITTSERQTDSYKK